MTALLRISSLSLAIIIVCAIVYNGISNHVLKGNIGLFPLSPFNFQSKLEYLKTEVRKTEISLQKLRQLEEVVDAGIKLEPLNTRILSFGGLIKERTDKDDAQAYYKSALGLERAESIALTQRYIYLIENRNFKDAIPIMELLFARWPGRFKQIIPTLPLLIQNKENFDAVLERFQNRPGGLSLIVQSVLEHTDQIGLAYQFVLAAHDRYNIDVHEISRFLTSKLLAQNRISDAYLLFHKTLFEEEKKNSGYVYNSGFRAEPTSFHFDWNIEPQAGVNMQRVVSRSLSSQSNQLSNPGGLEIKFLNAPVAFSNVSQLLYLPKKPFQLTINYSVDGFRGPSPVSVKLECVQSRAEIVEVELSKIDVNQDVKTSTFKVPTEKCDLQKISVSNNNIVESWQNRFKGKVTLHDISIKVLGS